MCRVECRSMALLVQWARTLLLLMLLVQCAVPADNVADCVCSSVPFGLRCSGTGCQQPQLAVAAAAATTLTLTSMAVTELAPGHFRGLEQLTALLVEDNQWLSNVSSGTFAGLHSLSLLSLSYNPQLRRLSADAFDGLFHLTELRLVKNGINSIADVSPALSPRSLPALLRLDISENSLGVIGEELLPMVGSPLQELRLELCQLDYIHSDALEPLEHLRGLYLNQNALNSSVVTNLIKKVIANRTPLTVLELSSMGFQRKPPTDLLAVVGSSNVTHLSLSHNQFQTVAAGSFPVMPNLEYLDLREVLAVTVEVDALSPKFLPNLKILLLGGNKLPGVGEGVLLPQLESLDLSSNSHERPSASYFTLGEGNFINMRQLSYLNLSYNNINSLTKNTFIGLSNLDRELSLKHCSISSIEISSFQDLKRLKFLSLEDNPLSGTNLTADIFYGLDSLEVLLLGKCGIAYLADSPSVFVHLKNLRYLSLEGNRIHTVKSEIFSPLSSLIGVDLSQNEIESWKNDTIFTNNSYLSILLLERNKLTYLSSAMLQDLVHLTHVNLGDNPFICYPPLFAEAEEWLAYTNTTIENFTSDAMPTCYSPDLWKGRNLTEFLRDMWQEDITSNRNLWWWVAVGVGALVLMAAVLSVVAYNYRAYFRYWLFLARMDLRRRGGTNCCGSEKRRDVSGGYSNYQYDAFVSYSSEDRNFVVRLVAMLENYEPFLKLCVFERDFQIGSAISESVLESVALSRRTLLVVSDAFARSQWCQWELQLAQHRRVFGDEGALVIVKLGEVPAAHMTPTLRYLLRTRVYLQWDSDPRKQRIFWEKLRAALAPPSISIKTTEQ